MMTLEEDNLQEIVANHDKVMVQYGATWCGLCRMLKPKFVKASKATEGVLFVYVDAEKFPLSRGLATVANLPTFAGFSGGALVANKTGSKKEFIQEVLDAVTSN